MTVTAPPNMRAPMANPLQDLARRVPQRWRRRVPAGLRNRIVKRFGHPTTRSTPPRTPNGQPRLRLGQPSWLPQRDLHDFHNPDHIGDVRSLPELPTGRYEEVIAQDVLEHLQREEVPPSLREWRRLLADGGRLWLRVPDLPSLLRWLQEDDGADRHRQVMHFLFGTQAYDGDFHHAGFSDVLLCDELHRAGFERVELEIRDEWLLEGDAFARPDGAPAPVALAWGTGFYRRELGDGPPGAGQRRRRAADVCRRGDVARAGLTLLSGEVHVSGAGVDAELAPGNHVLRFPLAAGANRVHFTAAVVQDVPGDARELAFQLGGTVERNILPV